MFSQKVEDLAREIRESLSGRNNEDQFALEAALYLVSRLEDEHEMHITMANEYSKAEKLIAKLTKERDAYKMAYEDTVASYARQTRATHVMSHAFDIMRDILTHDVLREIGSEKHEIVTPDKADTLKEILHGSGVPYVPKSES